ncbi:phospholipid methyltransferase [Rhodanobacter sp. Soil772]|uniref:class I SAM-dependent methyltransferase n=1 Tax=Rhodanobacter sp. Soil772 TaxID=1736406 RepID=UPI0006FCCCBA|nr:phospholipid methyltransferase [Rhodanobacter sp. Soil772]KRE87485.1 phospholipid methyltransferase [Rhodanobacter sp. Soil772]
MPLNDTLAFLRAWLRDPRGIGAVTPSGAALARLMTSHVSALGGPVIELGPGTGALTRALLARGVPPHRLALIEADVHFADALSRRYPEATILRMDAARLGDTESLFGDERACAVVSGLPLLSMPPAQVAAIVQGVFERQLHSDGMFYQFTYGLRCPLPPALLARLNLQARRVGNALLNLPPAAVYCISRRPDHQVAA